MNKQTLFYRACRTDLDLKSIKLNRKLTFNEATNYLRDNTPIGCPYEWFDAEVHYYGTFLDSGGHFQYILNYQSIVKDNDPMHYPYPFDPEHLYVNKLLKVGDKTYHHVNGYSILRVEGSPYDKRPGSVSVFFVMGKVLPYTLTDYLIHNTMYPQIYNAIRDHANNK